MGDLREIVPIEGQFRIGKSWLPIVRTRISKKSGRLGIFMESSDICPDLIIPLDTRVRVDGREVRMTLESGDAGDVTIMLDRGPDF